MSLTNKIKAFTLLETMIAMLISGVVAAICFTGYSMAQKQRHMLSKELSTASAITQFSVSFKYDAFVSDEIQRSNQGFEFLSEKRPTVRYSFESNRILRKSGNHVDEIFLNCTTPEFETAAASPNLISYIYVSITEDSSYFPIVIHKSYNDLDLLIFE